MTLHDFLDQFRALHSPNPAGDDAPARDESAGTGRFATAEECRQYLPGDAPKINCTLDYGDMSDISNLFDLSLAPLQIPASALKPDDANRSTLEFLERLHYQNLASAVFARQVKVAYCSCGRVGTQGIFTGTMLLFRKNKRGYWTCGRQGHSQMKARNWKKRQAK